MILWLHRMTIQYFFFQQIVRNYSKVRKLKTNKVPGYDGIDNIILKHIINYILDPLVFLLNLSLQSGKVPSDILKLLK